MSKSTEQQFEEANTAVKRAVAAFRSTIEGMLDKCASGKWVAVAPSYILQCTLVELCEEMTRLIDDPRDADLLGPAGIKLSNALADYRDSRPSERFGPLPRL
jgi:hypothetical protein